MLGGHLGGLGQDPGGQLLGAHLKAVEAHDAPLNRALAAIGQDALLVGLGDVECDVGRKRGFTHRRTTREDQKVGAVQPAQLFVHIDQSGRDTGHPTFAHVGGVGDLNGVGDSRQKGLKPAFGFALFGEGIQMLFCGHDLIAGVIADAHVRGFGGDVAPQSDQFAPDREVIDHLGVVAHRIG